MFSKFKNWMDDRKELKRIERDAYVEAKLINDIEASEWKIREAEQKGKEKARIKALPFNERMDLLRQKQEEQYAKMTKLNKKQEEFYNMNYNK